MHKHYLLRDGLLCHRSRASGSWIPIVPKKARQNILGMCRDAPTAVHLGERQTLDKILQRFWRPSLRGDVRQYVASCTAWQMRKTAPNLGKPDLQLIQPPESPFELLGRDHLGCFPKSETGNRRIIVANDYLTKLVEVQTDPDTSAVHHIRFVNNNLVLRHGAPRVIVSDRGKHH